MNPGLLGRIARRSATRPWLTISLWLALIVTAAASAGTIGNHISSTEINLVTTDSDRAAALNKEFRSSTGEGQFAEQLLVTSHTAASGSPEFEAVLAHAVTALNAIDGVSDVASGDIFVSSSGRSAMVDVTVKADDAVLATAVAAVNATATDEVDAFIAGPETTRVAVTELAQADLARGEGIGIVIALVVLVFVFGAVVAAGIPILVAITSIVIATGLSAVVARILDANGTPIGDTVTVFAGMMGLALGIDYSLLTVQRFREELARGRTVIDAITITGDTANRAVLTSGLVVVASIGGLMLLPQNTFLGIGVAIIAVAVAAISITLFLLPAVLRLVGTRINAWRLPMRHPGETSRGWTRLSAWIVRRPGFAAAAGLTVLGIFMAPLMSLQFAFPSTDAWPDDFVAKRANGVLTQDFGFTDTSTMVAVVGASDAEVSALATAIDNDPGYVGAAIDYRDGAAFIDVHDAFAATDPESASAIDRLRHQIIPAVITSTGAEAFVGGPAATDDDNYDLIASAAPWAVAFILGVTFVLLLVMFRSIVVPLKAILMNLIGTAATFGILVAAFQWGWGEPLGMPAVDGVSPFMPVMIFALVFGLSMDYHVFLLSRIRERYEVTGNTKESVAEGLAKTGPLITGAAFIMIGVFGGFASASIPELAQWGLGLAVGVLLDATIIRILLVPAAMTWLDAANWYLPSWLEWLPRIGHGAAARPAATRAVTEEPVLV